MISAQLIALVRYPILPMPTNIVYMKLLDWACWIGTESMR